MGRARHLVRRCCRWIADSRRARAVTPPPDLLLSVTEVGFWDRMRRQDRAHALRVLARFDAIRPVASMDERRGVLLHDVGKIESDIGLVARIAATVLGPRVPRWRTYLDHERLGAEMLRRSGSAEATWRLVGGDGEAGAVRACREADDE